MRATATTSSPLSGPSPSRGSPPETTSATAPAATRDGALALLLRLGEATAAELALQLMVSVQAMRRHLRSLEEDGFVEASPAAEGPGRPSNRWRLSDRGRARFPQGGEDFALGLLHSMAASLPPDQMRALMREQAEQKADDYRTRISDGPLQKRLERLVELRRKEGFVAELLRDPEHKGAWIISEFHCSVMRIAMEFPMVCDQELQLIRSTFPDCQVERVHWRLEQGHSCGFRLLPSPASTSI
jgi:DeoR family suf operon transcriptional repressor